MSLKKTSTIWLSIVSSCFTRNLSSLHIGWVTAAAQSFRLPAISRLHGQEHLALDTKDALASKSWAFQMVIIYQVAGWNIICCHLGVRSSKTDPDLNFSKRGPEWDTSTLRSQHPRSRLGPFAWYDSFDRNSVIHLSAYTVRPIRFLRIFP